MAKTAVVIAEPLIFHDEAAAYLGVSPWTLHCWNSKKTGPRSYRVGRYRKYRVSELNAWLESRASDAS